MAHNENIINVTQVFLSPRIDYSHFVVAEILRKFGSAQNPHYKLIKMLCNAVTCPHLERSGMSTACSRSASAHLYHEDSKLTPGDGAVVCQYLRHELPAEAVLSISFVLRAVLCAVRIKLQKEIIFLRVLLIV